jgi:polysaccharide pyruvyl transferase WcaK-like protein
MTALSPLHIVVWGGYGGGNVGDYLTLDQGLHTLKTRYSAATIHILDLTNPGLTQSLFPDVQVISQKTLIYTGKHWASKVGYRVAQAYSRVSALPLLPSPLQTTLIKTLKRADLLYCVGGGYFNDVYNLDGFLMPLEWAKQLGIPIETAPVGVGPFNQPTALHRFVRVFSGGSITVRDAASAEQIKPYLHHTLAPDDGFAWAARYAEANPDLNPTPFYPTDHCAKKNPRLKVAVCALHSQEGDDPTLFNQWWQTVCAELGDVMSIEWLPFSFDYRPHLEAQLMQRIWPNLTVLMPTRQHFHLPVQAIRQADVVLTGRFHPAVLSASFNKPCIAVYSSDYYASKLHPLANPGQCVVRHYASLSTPDVANLIATLLNRTYAESTLPSANGVKKI